VGVPVGVTDPGLLNDPDWTSDNALMAVVELVGVLLVVVITRPWSLRLPAWLVLFPAWMGTGLLFLVVVAVALTGVVASFGGGTGIDLGGLRPWVFVLVYAGFTGQGVALAIAFGCYVRARWGRLLEARTGDVLAGRTPLSPGPQSASPYWRSSSSACSDTGRPAGNTGCPPGLPTFHGRTPQSGP
jgi:hypothetical protein